MQILPSNEVDFKYVASLVADEHMRTSKPLDDCIIEAADKHNFTPEEIKRLVEKTNTEVALRHLRGESKKANFALASYADILKRTHGAASDADTDSGSSDNSTDTSHMDKEAAGTAVTWEGESRLPNTRAVKTLGNPFACGQIKTATVRVYDGQDLFSVKKEYEKARMLKTATEMRLESNLNWLAKEMRGKDKREIAKMASAAAELHGADAKKLICSVADKAGCGPLPKLAMHIGPADDRSEFMQKAASAYNDLLLLQKQAQRVKQFETLLNVSEAAVDSVIENMWR